jgi:NitT/TauT family transport system substrate-binding protein
MKKSCFAAGGCQAWTLVVLVACLFVAAPSYVSAAPAKVVVVVPHRVLFTVAVPIYVAQERGFFKESGIDVDVVFTKGGGENVQAVVSGDAQVGLSTGFFAVLSAFAKGAPVKIVASEITGMDTFWYALGNSPIRKFEDLAGKKVAYSLPGSSTHMAVLAIVDQLKAKGLKPGEPVSLGGIPDTFTGTKTGQTDAGWSVAPFFLDRVEKGEIRIVVKGSEIIALNDLTMRVHFANADFARKQPEALKGFLRAHQKAVDFMFESPRETTKIWIKRAELKLPEATVLKTWEFYSRAALAAKPVRGVEKTMEDAVKFKFLKAPLSQAEAAKLIDLSYLP